MGRAKRRGEVVKAEKADRRVGEAEIWLVAVCILGRGGRVRRRAGQRGKEGAHLIFRTAL